MSAYDFVWVTIFFFSVWRRGREPKRGTERQRAMHSPQGGLTYLGMLQQLRGVSWKYTNTMVDTLSTVLQLMPQMSLMKVTLNRSILIHGSMAIWSLSEVCLVCI